VNKKLIVILLGALLSVVAPGTYAVASAEPGGVLSLSGIGTLGLPDWLAMKPAKAMENQPNSGAQYDLVGLERDTWHYARVVAYKMEQNLGAASLLFGVAESNPQILGELAKPLLNKSLEENGGRILEWTPAKKAMLGGRSVPVITSRLIMTDKVPLPMAATVYVFMNHDRLFALGVFAPDSDRQFWAQLFRQMAADMKWE
jgi:hypothetical protein